MAWIVAAGLLLMLCRASPAPAQDVEDVLANYSLTTWGGTDGFVFGDTNTIAQDATGYLWLGTSVGLVRFDGVRFVPWNISGVPAGIFITALHASSDGSLWVGLSTGIVRIRNDEATLYTSREGFRGDLVARIVEDDERTIWVTSAAGVWRFRNNLWERIGPTQGLSARSSSALLVAPDGMLWVGTADGIFRRDAGLDIFQRVSDSSSLVTAMVGDSFGSIWATDPVQLSPRCYQRQISWDGHARDSERRATCFAIAMAICGRGRWGRVCCASVQPDTQRTRSSRLQDAMGSPVVPSVPFMRIAKAISGLDSPEG